MRRALLLLVTALLGLTTVTACSGSTAAPTIDATGATVIDVRTPAEYASGHLPNAVNLDVESPTFATGLSQLDPEATYAVYCRSGNRSKVALDQMKEAGIENAQDLDGGIVGWQAEGLPVVQ